MKRQKHIVMIRILIIIFLCVIWSLTTDAREKRIAITLDDFLKAFDTMGIGQLEEASTSLLKAITELQVPVTIFVNEQSVLGSGARERRLAIYDAWIENPLITIGNHTYSHKNYANTSLALFEEDILNGETLTKERLKASTKTLKYFRFPFNCTGKDLESRTAIFHFLANSGYINTPFTIESMDYVYNRLYRHHLTEGDEESAQDIIAAYLDFTGDVIQYFEELSQTLHGRNIRHIFLGHTNALHVACFEQLITRLRQQGYTMVSLDEALADDIYQQTDYYTEQFGISWMYRWIEAPDGRMTSMKREPFPADIATQYKQLGQ